MTDGNSHVRAVVLSLLAIMAVSAGVVFEAEANYAAITLSDDATAHVTEVTKDESGLEFQLTVTNPLNHPVRIEYVRLEIDDGNESVGVNVPFNGYESVPPGDDVEIVDAFVIERRYERLSPIDGPLTVNGYLEVTIYNGYQFKIPIDESEVEL